MKRENITSQKGRRSGSGGLAKALTAAEIDRVEAAARMAAHPLRDLAIFFLGLGSGMRIGEVVGLRVGQVRNEDGSIVDQIALEKHSTKSNKSRTVFISRQAQKYLAEHVDTLKNTDPDAPVFFGQKITTRPMSANVAVNLLRRLFERAGVKNASSHSLRRTHANTLRKNGVDLMIVKEQLGHSSLQVTQRYFSVDPAEVSEVVGKLKF